jgi:hypothetical protein
MPVFGELVLTQSVYGGGLPAQIGFGQTTKKSVEDLELVTYKSVYGFTDFYFSG